MDSVNTDEGVYLSRRTIFELWKKTPQNLRVTVIKDFILNHLNTDCVNSSVSDILKTFVKKVCEQFRYRWKLKGKRLNSFLELYGGWLNEPLDIPSAIIVACRANKMQGRPSKPFQECGPKSKKRKVERLVRDFSAEELTFAAQTSTYVTGKRDASQLIKQAMASPKRANKYVHAMRTSLSLPTAQPYTPDEAVGFIIANKLSVFQYKNIEKETRDRGFKIYPSYERVLKAKKECYPPVEALSITEESVETSLQMLLNHTVQRLCKYLEEVLESITDTNFNLYLKWGCDGSSGHSRYKQKMSTPERSDESMICLTIVPLRLTVLDEKSTLIWQNPRPSSSRYCRPIKLLYHKETIEVVKEECNKIISQINNLVATQVSLHSRTITVSCTLQLTMVDTKICNSLTNTTSTQRCYICGATSKDMNNLPKLKQLQPNEERYSFGLSSLHAYIRTMECLLNISYRIDIKQWQIRDKELKKIRDLKKKKVHDEFWEQTGLHIDEPRQGAGNSNDGNTARRFFSNPVITSSITGLNSDLIRHLGTLLQAISSGYEINTESYEKLANEIAQIYLQNYSWYNMPVTLHKILYHGSEIIKSCIIPIGQMAEEAQEARNKEERKIKEAYSRKTSRIACNADIFNYLLISSDPYITGLRKTPNKHSKSFSSDVLKLFKEPTV